jgi:hypothetical protein
MKQMMKMIMKIFDLSHWQNSIIHHPIIWIMLVLCLILFILPFCNKFLPIWACKWFGWHLAPHHQTSDGCSWNGECPRCKKHVLQDSQGNWF